MSRVAPCRIAADGPAPQGYAMRRWSLEWSRRGVAVTTMRESFGLQAPRPARRGLAVLSTGTLGVLALVFAGATAGNALSRPQRPGEVGIAVPAAIPYTPRKSRRHAVRAALAAEPAVQTVPVAASSPSAPDASRRAFDQAGAIEAAFATGDMQEWRGSAGVTGYAVAGPAEAENGLTCRAMAVLTRTPDGTSAVASSRRCSEAPNG